MVGDTIDTLKLWLVILISLSVFIPTYIILKERGARLIYFFGSLGLICYSGLGYSFIDLPLDYVLMFLVYYILLSLSFALIVASRLFVPKHTVQARADALFSTIERNSLKIITLYLGILLLPLIVPEFRILDLLRPPSIDLRSSLASRFSDDMSPVGYLSSLFANFLFPLYIAAVYSLKSKPTNQVLIIVFGLYVSFVGSGYIGRYVIVQYAILIFLFLWEGGKIRKPIIIWTSTLFGAFLVGMYNVYETIRLGVVVSIDKLPDLAISSFSQIFFKEFYYPSFYDIITKNSGSVDLSSYFVWILTLPIPKILIGNQYSFYLNNEIASYLVSKEPGDPNFYIMLVSSVLEGLFIYGKYYWLHAVFCGLLFGVIYNLIRFSTKLVPITLYIAIEFALLARGGVAGIVPILVNQMLIIYIVYAYSLIKNPKNILSRVN